MIFLLLFALHCVSLQGLMTALHSSFFPPIPTFFHRRTFPIISSFPCNRLLKLTNSISQGRRTEHTHSHTHAPLPSPLYWPLLHLPQGLGVRQPGTRQLFKPSGSFTTGQRQKQRKLKREVVKRGRKRAADYSLINCCLNYRLWDVGYCFWIVRTETLWSLFWIIFSDCWTLFAGFASKKFPLENAKIYFKV